MITEPVKIQDIVDYMNEVLAADPITVSVLVRHRTPCNETLAEHPTVQVKCEGHYGYSISPLGVLCGLAEHLTGGRLAVEIDYETGTLLKFTPYNPVNL